MFEIDRNKVIKLEPNYYIWGVKVKNKKHSKILMLNAKISITFGIIGMLGLISVFSYLLIH